MLISKSLRLSAGVVAIVTLLATTSVFAQTHCSSVTPTFAKGNFTVDVDMQTVNGRTTYTYTVQSPTGKNPNKFFIYIKRGLQDDIVAKDTDGNRGVYLTPEHFFANFPPTDAWKTDKHNDGIVFASVAIKKTLLLDVSERLKPEEGFTTIILGKKDTDERKKGTDERNEDTYEACGPILGPTTLPAGQEIPGSPVATDQFTVTMDNGCVYDLFFNSFTNYLSSIITDRSSPAKGTDERPCTVTTVSSVAGAVGLTFIPPTKKGDLPIQQTSGGICYYLFTDGSGARFPC